MPFVIMSHTINNSMNLSEAEVGNCNVYLSSRKSVISRSIFSPFSPFSFDHCGNARLMLTLTVFEMDSDMKPFISRPFLQLTPNLATPELLRMETTHRQQYIYIIMLLAEELKVD